MHEAHRSCSVMYEPRPVNVVVVTAFAVLVDLQRASGPVGLWCTNHWPNAAPKNGGLQAGLRAPPHPGHTTTGLDEHGGHEGVARIHDSLLVT
jgi:hypothetical protein